MSEENTRPEGGPEEAPENRRPPGSHLPMLRPEEDLLSVPTGRISSGRNQEVLDMQREYTERRRRAEETARMAEDIYERRIRAEVEPDLKGRFLVIDVDSGDYVTDEYELDAFSRAEKRYPGGRFFLMRVGHRGAHRVGTASSR